MKTILSLLSLALFASLLSAQPLPDKKAQILAALKAGGKNAAMQILDSQGRAQGDYDIVQPDHSVRLIVRDLSTAFALRFLADYYAVSGGR